MRDLAKASSEVRSHVMGRVVDSYTNILTVKLFARARDEDAYVREVIDEHAAAIAAHMRLITRFMGTLATMNALLLVATAGIGITLWGQDLVSAGIVATALPLAWQIANVAGWVSWEVTGIFENIGVVQEGMETIAVPHALVDRPDARELDVTQRRDPLRRTSRSRTAAATDAGSSTTSTSSCARASASGLVGRSGAGKSTLVNLLLRFHELEQGSIRIDGQDIRYVTQESLRAAIGMVTQDTSLLHRSIAANIGYGRPGATRRGDRERGAARARARVHRATSWTGSMRTGYDAHVGERGVKLSGGQRQRIAIARVILKNAPILVLDEATSALDSEVELAIQDQLLGLMEGKTVIAIAHRLSTIARMDRLIVLEQGRIVEEGTHDALLRARRPLRAPVEASVRRLPAARRAGGRGRAWSRTGPVDDMRAEEQPEPSTNDEPIRRGCRNESWLRSCIAARAGRLACAGCVSLTARSARADRGPRRHRGAHAALRRGGRRRAPVVPAPRRRGPALDPARIRVLTWNIHKQDDAGWDATSRASPRDHDIVLLQEVTLIDPLTRHPARRRACAG